MTNNRKGAGREPLGAAVRVVAVLGAAGCLGTPAAAAVALQRTALQARVDAVRQALATQAPALTTLVAQANWGNWPKWGKWSNWVNQ